MVFSDGVAGQPEEPGAVIPFYFIDRARDRRACVDAFIWA